MTEASGRSIGIGAALATLALAAMQAQSREAIAEAVSSLTRDSRWTLVRSVPVAFKTFHPQGMVRIGDELFVSSVEVREPTKRGPQPDGRSDRDVGAGVGHLFKMTMTGALVADLTLGEGSLYHPGGIDFDGTHIWVAVAEYRPDSHSIVYRIDPQTMKATEVLRAPDHLGAVVHNTDDRTLHAVSWGSRRFYRWALDRDGSVRDRDQPLDRVRTINHSHYVDYQDCKYAGRRRMLCTGVSELRPSASGPPFRLGGLELVDLRDGRALHQVPVPLWTGAGLDMTRNPSWFEGTPSGLRAYFMPEDDASTLYVFEAAVK
jgi:hypothetical protein